VGDLRTAQLEVLDVLEASSLRATDDPKQAVTRRPIVLVGPPRVDYTTRLCTHQLVLLTSHASGTLEALEQLDGMLADLVDVLPIESAAPGTYALTPADDPLPCLLATMTSTTTTL
jgi:hypothetical protein